MNIGHNILKRKTLNSTNNYTIALLKKNALEEGTVVWTENQTEGRGQANNVWESQAGKNLTFSIIVYPDVIKADEQFRISQAVSLAVSDYLCYEFSRLELDKERIKIKWSNDMYVDDKKICGILIENSIRADSIVRSIIGIGLNINQIKFISSAPNPVSLRQITGMEYNISSELKKLCRFLSQRYEQLKNCQFYQIETDYLASMYRFNSFHLYQCGSETFTAKITGVNPLGQLLLETKNGKIRTFNFKEVTFII